MGCMHSNAQDDSSQEGADGRETVEGRSLAAVSCSDARRINNTYVRLDTRERGRGRPNAARAVCAQAFREHDLTRRLNVAFEKVATVRRAQPIFAGSCRKQT